MIIIIFQTFDCFLFSAYISFCWILLLCIFKHHVKRSLDALFGGPFLGSLTGTQPTHCTAGSSTKKNPGTTGTSLLGHESPLMEGGGTMVPFVFSRVKKGHVNHWFRIFNTPFFGPTTILGWSNHNSSTDLTEIMYRRSLNRPLLVPIVGTK